MVRAVATPASSSAREAEDGSVAGGNSPGGEAGLVSAIATPRTRMGGGGASHDEVLDDRGVRAIVRKMVRGVALPTEEHPRRIDGICVTQVDLLPGVETNPGLRGLRECEVGLRCGSLTDVVVERQAREKGKEGEIFTVLGSCLPLRSNALSLRVGRLDAVGILRIGLGGRFMDGEEFRSGFMCGMRHQWNDEGHRSSSTGHRRSRQTSGGGGCS